MVELISGLCATPPSPCCGRHSKVGHFLVGPSELYILCINKHTVKLSLRLAYWTYFLDYLSFA
jgi:hypothetical protein